MTDWRGVRRILLIALVAGLVPVSAPAAGAALPFSGVDPTFGDDGVYRLDMTEPSLDVANAVAGGIAAGSAGDRFALSKIDSDGAGPYGERIIVDFGLPSAAYTIAEFPSGRLTAAGRAGDDFAVAKASPSGEVAFHFGDAGKVRTSFGAPAVAYGVADMYDLRSLAVGTVKAGAGSSVAMALYDLSGDLVPSFGAGGKLVHDLTPGADSANAAMTTSTEFGTSGLRILVAGRAGGAAFVARYHPDGQPDLTFGSGGVVLLDLTAGDDVAHALSLHPGGLLVAGSAGAEAFVARITSAGALDPTFATAGVFRTTAGGTAARFRSVSRTSDSKVLAMGAVAAASGEDGVAVRLSASGSIDTTFGTGGSVVVDLGGNSDMVNGTAGGTNSLRFVGGNGADMVFATVIGPGPPERKIVDFGAPTVEVANAVTVLPDGRVIAAGHGTRGLIVARLLPDGSPDRTFGSGGFSVLPTPRLVVAVVVHGGRIYVLAEDYGRDFSGVFRFTENGALDTSWGGGLLVATNVSSSTSLGVLPGGRVVLGGKNGTTVVAPEGVTATEARVGEDGDAGMVAVQPDGKYVVLYGGTIGYGASLYRINPDGTRDPTFHNSSWLSGSPVYAQPKALVRLADGRFVVAAVTPKLGYDPGGDLVVARFTAGGALDRSFGTAGVTRTTAPGMTWVTGVDELPDGKIVVTYGTSGEPAPGGQARFLPDGQPDAYFADSGLSTFAGVWPQAAAVDPVGRSVIAGENDGDFVVARLRPVVPSPSTFHPLAPVRLLDTRVDGGRLSAGGTLPLRVAGRGGVPATGATSVVLNVTVTEPTAGGFLTAWPAGRSQPLASNLNFSPGQTVPNLVVVKLGAGGVVNLYNNSGTTHVVADLAGWYGSGGARYTPVTPARILDSRTGNGAPATPVGAGSTLPLQVTGRGGVPSTGVSAVVLNVTATETSGGGYLTLWPAGSARPLASNLNYAAGQTVPNLVVVKVGDGGKVNLYNSSGSMHVVADVAGWYGATGADYSGIVPFRLLDTRTGNGAPLAMLGPESPLSLQVTGRGGVPSSGVSAVILNVTVTEPTALSFLTAWPAGEPRPLASNLNFPSGLTVPNLVAVKVGADGRINLYNNSGWTHVIADVAGWYGT